MVLFDYFVRLPSLAAYVAYDKATALYLIGRRSSTVGVYTFLSANSVQEKLRLWSLKLMNSVANILSFIS